MSAAGSLLPSGHLLPRYHPYREGSTPITVKRGQRECDAGMEPQSAALGGLACYRSTKDARVVGSIGDICSHPTTQDADTEQMADEQFKALV